MRHQNSLHFAARITTPFGFWAATGLLWLSQAAFADTAAEAAVENGRKLVAEAKCESCHAAKLGGDGSAIYSRKDRRVTAKSKLLPQVARCNSELSLGLFPDDEAAIAAYLNARYYQFKGE